MSKIADKMKYCWTGFSDSRIDINMNKDNDDLKCYLLC
jgi:hypothetical protein